MNEQIPPPVAQPVRPSPDALLDPKCDTTFKALFTENSDEARLALKSFLEAVLNAKVSNIQLRPNEEAIESLTDKDSVFDITCTLNDSEAVNIEMQGWSIHNSYDKRAEYYAAHLLNHYTTRGSDWAKVPKVFQISVLNFVYDKSTDKFFSLYTMRTEDSRCLSDRMTVIFIELPKLKRKLYRKTDDGKTVLIADVKSLTTSEKWVTFLLYADSTDSDKQRLVREICEGEEGIMAAQTVLSRISDDESEWQRQMSRDKWLRDVSSGIHEAEQRGEHNAKLETARNMLNKNLSIEMIAECTGLTLAEVTALQAEMASTATA